MSDNTDEYSVGDLVRDRRYPLGMSGVVVGHWQSGTARLGWPMVAWDDWPEEGVPCNPAHLFKERRRENDE